MWEKKKNIFPKLQKKIKWFLTDESGKISKKDALWLWVWTMLLSTINEASAASCSFTAAAAWTVTITVDATAHLSGLYNWHYSGTPAVTPVCWHGSHGSHGSHASHGSCCWGTW